MIFKRPIAVVDPQPCSVERSGNKIEESIVIEITGSESLAEVICGGTGGG